MRRVGATLIGVGLWLCQRPRQPLAALPGFAAMGLAAIGRLNESWARAEFAARHAKPSTRRRVL